jgi:hypothetical protein
MPYNHARSERPNLEALGAGDRSEEHLLYAIVEVTPRDAETQQRAPHERHVRLREPPVHDEARPPHCGRHGGLVGVLAVAVARVQR